MLQQVSTFGCHQSSLSCCHCSLPWCTNLTHKCHSWVVQGPCWSIQTTQNVASHELGQTLLLTNIVAMYKELAVATTLSCPTMAHLIWGATFSPNPMWVKQILCSLIFTVLNGYKDLSIGYASMPSANQNSDIWPLLSPLSQLLYTRLHWLCMHPCAHWPHGSPWLAKHSACSLCHQKN